MHAAKHQNPTAASAYFDLAYPTTWPRVSVVRSDMNYAKGWAQAPPESQAAWGKKEGRPTP